MWALLLPDPGRAASVAVEDSGPAFTAAPGEANVVIVNAANGTFTFSDAGAAVSAGPGCVSVDAHTARCTSSGGRVAVRLGDLADSVVISGTESRCLGGDGDDELRGGGRRDELWGDAGDDRLVGDRGPDAFDGGSGLDTADYADRAKGVLVTLNGLADDGNSADGPESRRDNVRDSVENVTGTSGLDRLTGNDLPNGLRGGGGNDVLRGLEGEDALFGEADNDQLNGGDGGDDLRGGSGKDVAGYADRSLGVTVSLDGVRNDGNASDGPLHDNVNSDIEDVTGGAGEDSLTGNASANTLTGEGAKDRLRGEGGGDLLGGGAGADDMQGGTGFDVVSYVQRTGAVNVTLDDAANDGGSEDRGADNVHSDVDEVIGGSGGDLVSAAGVSAARVLRGGGGDDTLIDGSGADLLAGGDGDDDIALGLGLDHASGDAGNDVLRSGGGEDELDGGTGDDELSGQRSHGGPGNDTLYGYGGHNELDGGPDADLLIGSIRNDELTGGDGNDTLRGGGSSDALFGEAGDDDLDGGVHGDTMIGGEGFDTIHYDQNRPEGGVIVTTGPGTDRDGNDWDCPYSPQSNDGECEGSYDPDAPQAQGIRGDNAQGERVLGTPQADDLTGDDGANLLLGGDGADDLDGLGGDDVIEARDGTPDTVTCGTGTDTAVADAVDTVDAASCETIELP